MNVGIRPLSENDSITELTDVLHAAYAQLGALGFNYTAVDQSEGVTRDRVSKGECFIAHDGERIVGTILFCDPGHTRGNAWYDKPAVSYFGQFGVLPSFQQHGIGKGLLAVVENRALESGAAEISFDTSEGAADLIRWYSRRGYREVGHTQHKGKPYRSVLMSKALGFQRSD